jgi:hypothetical protein
VDFAAGAIFAVLVVVGGFAVMDGCRKGDSSGKGYRSDG